MFIRKLAKRNIFTYRINSIIISILLVYINFLTSCGKNTVKQDEIKQEDEYTQEKLMQTQKNKNFRINAVTIKYQTIYRRINIDGSIKAQETANISPDTSGILHSLLVEEGEFVRKNQVIAQIEPSRPGKKYLLSPVKASISGTISTIFIDIGNKVNVNSVIAEVTSSSDLEVELFVPERYANDVKVGVKGTVSLIAFHDETFPVIIKTASSALSSLTHTMKVTLDFLHQDSRLKSGMFGTVELILGEIKDVPIVRIDYIVQRFRDGKTLNGVFKVIEKDGIKKVTFQKINLGVEDGIFYQVTEGLSEGDIIAVSGQKVLVEGVSVEILQLDDIPVNISLSSTN